MVENGKNSENYYSIFKISFPLLKRFQNQFYLLYMVVALAPVSAAAMGRPEGVQIRWRRRPQKNRECDAQ